MLYLLAPRLALAVVAFGAFAPGALDGAFVLVRLPRPMAGAPHG